MFRAAGDGIHGDSHFADAGFWLCTCRSPPTTHDAETASQSSRTKHPKTETASTKPPATKSSQIERVKTGEEETVAIVHHKVKHGETLYSIANLYNTTVAALKRDNRNISVLRPGMILTVQLAR